MNLATKKWIFMKISSAILLPLMLWFIINFISIYNQNYLEVLKGEVTVGDKVAIIGAGGIGFDVADFLTHDADAEGFHKSWGIDESLSE